MASFKTLLVRSALALLACAAGVAVCYFFIDRPVAFYVHGQGVNKFRQLIWLTEIALVLDALSCAMILLAVVRLAKGPLTHPERVLFAASISLMLAVAFEAHLKFLFGRYWPETWVHDNLSLIRDGAYGFHLFHHGTAYGSFPSGHTARAVAVMAVVWVAWPGWRWLCVAVPALVVVGLVGMNYHFVGDTVGGAFLGALTGAYTARFFRVGPDGRADGPDPG